MFLSLATILLVTIIPKKNRIDIIKKMNVWIYHPGIVARKNLRMYTIMMQMLIYLQLSSPYISETPSVCQKTHRRQSFTFSTSLVNSHLFLEQFWQTVISEILSKFIINNIYNIYNTNSCFLHVFQYDILYILSVWPGLHDSIPGDMAHTDVQNCANGVHCIATYFFR